MLGDAASLLKRAVLCDHLCFMGIPEMQCGAQLAAEVKIRYHHTAQSAVCEIQDDGSLCIRFEEPVRAAAPGQSAVVYDSAGRILCSGFIR